MSEDRFNLDQSPNRLRAIFINRSTYQNVMAEIYIYSTMAGTVALDSAFKVVDKTLLQGKEAQSAAASLSQGKHTPSERKIAEKHKGHASVIFLGIYEEDLSGTKAVNEVALLDRASVAVRSAGLLQNIRENSILLCRQSVRESVSPDALIIQAANAVTETDRAANLLIKRLREWASYSVPEFVERISDNEKLVSLILEKERDVLLKESGETISHSMGAVLSKEDLSAMLSLARQINALFDARKQHESYLKKAMEKNCPNITSIAGFAIAAKLLSISGSLKNLAGFPASTIQMLGAEKALFRHLKSRARPPKHGVLHEHPLVSRAPYSLRGKVARLLADKLAIAARVDYFKGKFIGDKIKEDIDARVMMMNA